MKTLFKCLGALVTVGFLMASCGDDGLFDRPDTANRTVCEGKMCANPDAEAPAVNDDDDDRRNDDKDEDDDDVAPRGQDDGGSGDKTPSEKAAEANDGYEPVASGDAGYLLPSKGEVVISREAFPSAEKCDSVYVLGVAEGNPDKNVCSNAWEYAICGKNLLRAKVLPNGDTVVNQAALHKGDKARFTVACVINKEVIGYMRAEGYEKNGIIFTFLWEGKKTLNVRIARDSSGKLVPCGDESFYSVCETATYVGSNSTKP